MQQEKKRFDIEVDSSNLRPWEMHASKSHINMSIQAGCL